MCTDVLGPIMDDLLRCAEQDLINCGTPVDLVHLAPGSQVAWDNCCEGGGQLWVRVVNVYPSGSPFPQQDALQNCGVSTLAARLGVGIVRCAHTLDGGGEPPTADEMTSDTLQTTSDMSILLQTILCCFSTDRRPTPRVEQWTPQGVDGGCVGGEWTLLVQVPACPCPGS